MRISTNMQIEMFIELAIERVVLVLLPLTAMTVTKMMLLMFAPLKCCKTETTLLLVHYINSGVITEKELIPTKRERKFGLFRLERLEAQHCEKTQMKSTAEKLLQQQDL